MTIGFHYKEEIKRALGRNALEFILNGNPQIHCLEEGTNTEFIVFWIYGHECEYWFDTDPILLRQSETDKEFTSFELLLAEIGRDLSRATGRHLVGLEANPGGL